MKLPFDIKRLDLKRFDLQHLEEMDPKAQKLTILALIGVIVLMTVSGLVAFSLALQGAEQTMVPDVKDLELTTALIKLQEKELYPRIALRFSSDPTDKGRILEQRPSAGTIVKAGRRINLTVSRGPAVNQVENYVGQTMDEVKIHLQTIFASSRPLLTVREPPIYKFDMAPAGTILEQKPVPGTEISGLTELTFVVSQGQKKAQISVPELLGLSIPEAMQAIEQSGITFTFAMRAPEGRERPGTVVSQMPSSGSVIDPATSVSIMVAHPAEEKDMVSGILEETLPVFPYPLKITLTAQYPTGEKVTLLTVHHSGGSFSVPYTVPNNTVLILNVSNRELLRREVRGE
jgi:eukaryotic-like serine/threonine-protein kinase